MIAKALPMNTLPISGLIVKIVAMREPEIAAIADPSPKVASRTRRTSIPQICATSGCWEVARIALPNVLRRRKRYVPPVTSNAITNATSRDLDTASPNTSQDPVNGSHATERKLEVQRLSATPIIRVDRPKVSSSEER